MAGTLQPARRPVLDPRWPRNGHASSHRKRKKARPPGLTLDKLGTVKIRDETECLADRGRSDPALPSKQKGPICAQVMHRRQDSRLVLLANNIEATSTRALPRERVHEEGVSNSAPSRPACLEASFFQEQHSNDHASPATPPGSTSCCGSSVPSEHMFFHSRAPPARRFVAQASNRF